MFTGRATGVKARQVEPIGVRAMPRYIVGPINKVVTRKSCTVCNMISGLLCSSNTVELPRRMGNNSNEPSPYVKPSGALPVNTSSTPDRRTSAG